MVAVPSIKNDKLLQTMSGHFPPSYSSSYGISSAVPSYLMLPQLRGFWPFSSVDENGDLYDLSGQGRVMTNVNTVAFATAGLVPYANFVRANSERFDRLDEVGLSITGDLAFGCWCFFDTESTGNITGLISKWVSGTNDRQFALIKTAADAFQFLISDDGTNEFTVSSTVTYAISTWYHIICRYVPSTSINICVNGTWTSNAVAIPAALHDSDETLHFGYHNGGNYLDGRMSLAFLQAYSGGQSILESLHQHTRPLFKVRT